MAAILKRIFSHDKKKSVRFRDPATVSSEKSPTLTSSQSVQGGGDHSVFGASPKEAAVRAGHSGLLLPDFFVEWIAYVEEEGTCVAGIYRNLSEKTDLERVAHLYDIGEAVRIRGFGVTFVADLIKLYMERMGRRLFENQPEVFVSVPDDRLIESIESRIDSIPDYNRMMLGCLVRHIRFMALHERTTGMSMRRIGLIFSSRIRLDFKIFELILERPDTFFVGHHISRTSL